jgi:hypothetical protein
MNLLPQIGLQAFTLAMVLVAVEKTNADDKANTPAASTVQNKEDSSQFVIVSGDKQSGYTMNYLPSALVVLVKDVTGHPVKNVSVHFSVDDKGGGIVGNSHQEPQSQLTVQTDAHGLAHVDFWQPVVKDEGKAQQVSIISAMDDRHHQVAFTETTSYADPDITPPSDLKIRIGGSYGEISLTWINHATNADYLKIEQSTDQVHWTETATINDPTATSYTVTNLDVTKAYYFRIGAGN